MAYAGTYSSKNPVIITKTLTNAGQWYQVTPEVKGVRKWFMKARESTDNSFDYAFEDSPTNYMTNSGSGVAFDGCDLPQVWAKSSTAGTVIELIYWS